MPPATGRGHIPRDAIAWGKCQMRAVRSAAQGTIAWFCFRAAAIGNCLAQIGRLMVLPGLMLHNLPEARKSEILGLLSGDRRRLRMTP